MRYTEGICRFYSHPVRFPVSTDYSEKSVFNLKNKFSNPHSYGFDTKSYNCGIHLSHHSSLITDSQMVFTQHNC